MARAREKKGSPSFAGYEYQILASVWIGLDLVLGKEATEAITIEPQSHEDVEASLDVLSDSASSAGAANLQGSRELIFQIKSRSTGAWSARNFADILLGRSVVPGKSSGKKKKGPGPTMRPDRMLWA